MVLVCLLAVFSPFSSREIVGGGGFGKLESALKFDDVGWLWRWWIKGRPHPRFLAPNLKDPCGVADVAKSSFQLTSQATTAERLAARSELAARAADLKFR
jgi:hypothetical protein